MKKLKDKDIFTVKNCVNQLTRGPRKREKNFSEGNSQMKFPWYNEKPFNENLLIRRKK